MHYKQQLIFNGHSVESTVTFFMTWESLWNTNWSHFAVAFVPPICFVVVKLELYCDYVAPPPKLHRLRLTNNQLQFSVWSKTTDRGTFWLTPTGLTGCGEEILIFTTCHVFLVMFEQNQQFFCLSPHHPLVHLITPQLVSLVCVESGSLRVFGGHPMLCEPIVQDFHLLVIWTGDIFLVVFQHWQEWIF